MPGDLPRDLDHLAHTEALPVAQVVDQRAGFLKGAERDYLAQLLNEYHGGIARCARHASVDQATLHRKIKAHGLRAGDFRQNGRVH